MAIDNLLDVETGYVKFTEALDNAKINKQIGDEEYNILITTVGTYVNSTVIMSMFQEGEIRSILVNKTYDMYSAIIIEPMMRGEMGRDMHTFTIRVSLIRSAVNLIASALKRAWNGRERDKVYGSFKVAGVMGEEGPIGPQSPIQIKDDDERGGKQ